MNTKLQSSSIIFLLVVPSLALLIAMIFYAQEQIQQNTTTVTEERMVAISQISNRIELRFSDAISILQIASKNVYMTSPPSSSSIVAQLHGIPENVDTDRRKVMHDIFDTYGQFQNLLFLLPNGDVYINEPFVFQKNMTASNFAFRDWFKNAIGSQSAVVSEVVVSKSSGKPNVVIAVPVFQNGTIQGILTGSVSLDKLQQSLPQFKSFSNERILIVDNIGTVAADSSGILKGQQLLTGRDETQKALTGESGTTTDIINGTRMFIAYYPAEIGQTRWVVISMQPYDETFSAILSSQELSYITIIIIVSITAISGFFAYRMIHANEILTTKLNQANMAREEFDAMVTHELKTPLVTINGYSEMLKEYGLLGTLNSEQEDAVNKIYESSRKLENIIKDMLTAQKLDMNKMRFNKEVFDVDEFMDDIIQTYSAVTRDKIIDFKNTTTETFTIETDKDRISQVFDNLIRNSIDFVPPVGGKIGIGAKRVNNQAIFFVKDNGSGIPKDKQNKLFKKFYQIDSSLKRKHGGTGLGLVICKGIVEALGGKIWFESDVDKGTTFWFSIPMNGSLNPG